MKTQTDKIQEPQKKTVQCIQQELSVDGGVTIVDNRSATAIQRKLRSGIDGSENTKVPIQRKNNTGLPDNLKSGIENLSGYSMDDVKVHYNSSKPTQLQAHAYAQGTNIHLAPGQEKHLPHEAWHVVQQKQGRVKPTRQLKSKVNINDDAGLEKEADMMGARALQKKSITPQRLSYDRKRSNIIQRVKKNKHIFRLIFAGSGHNYITKDQGNFVESNLYSIDKWDSERGVKVKKSPVWSENQKETLEELNVAGPGAPITGTYKITLMAAFESWAGNKIKKLKKEIFELVMAKYGDLGDKEMEVQIMGHSRGAVAGAYVAEKLKEELGTNISVTYSGYDPVPNAFISGISHLSDALGFKTTKPTNLEEVDRSAVVYSVASGQNLLIDKAGKFFHSIIPFRKNKKYKDVMRGIMKPKGLENPNVIIITCAQHSTNLRGTFQYGRQKVSGFNLVDLPNGVYVDIGWDNAVGKRGAPGAYGDIQLNMVTSMQDFDEAYKELESISHAKGDPGRKKEIRRIVDELLPDYEEDSDVDELLPDYADDNDYEPASEYDDLDSLPYHRANLKRDFL